MAVEWVESWLSSCSYPGQAAKPVPGGRGKKARERGMGSSNLLLVSSNRKLTPGNKDEMEGTETQRGV